MRDDSLIEGWPAGAIERLGACPLCGATQRSCIHEGLVDHLFGTPGHWSLQACSSCGIAYLDPRPSAQEVHRAYAQYFTHADETLADPALPGANWLESLKLSLLRPYLRRNFARSGWRPRDMPALLMRLLPRARREVDGAMRCLRPPHAGQTLLDVGCGNGRFLAWARFTGWAGCGTEVDAEAARRARAKGFEVHEGAIDALIASGRTFDAITISHVIEHVHDPRGLLQAACRLLKPGGHFWIETPNIAARGHECFGPDWRGLEPPRHLQIFTPDALRDLLAEVGFRDVRFAPWRGEFPWMAEASRQVARTAGSPRAALRWRAADERVGHHDPRKREFITLTATVAG